MFASARRALATLFDRDFVGLVLWSLVLAAILFAALFVGLEYALAQLPALGSVWVNRFLELAAPFVLILAVVALGAPVAAMVGSFFLDRIAAKIDARFYPNDPRPRGGRMGASLWESVKLIVLTLLINGALIPLDVGVPGVPEFAALLANGWLLGRQFFELASLRFLTPKDSDALRRRHGGKIYAAGLLIALFALVPGLDLIAPFFGAALMAHLFKRVTHQEARR